MAKFLDYVTITGADDNTNIDDLIDIYNKHSKFVEFAILFDKKHIGNFKYPSSYWIYELLKKAPKNMRLSLHLGGSIVRDALIGDFVDVLAKYPFISGFQRIQLNTIDSMTSSENLINVCAMCPPEEHVYRLCSFMNFVNEMENLGKQVILQYDGINKKLVDNTVLSHPNNIHVLSGKHRLTCPSTPIDPPIDPVPPIDPPIQPSPPVDPPDEPDPVDPGPTDEDGPTPPDPVDPVAPFIFDDDSDDSVASWKPSPYINIPWGYTDELGLDNIVLELDAIYLANRQGNNPLVWIDAGDKLRTIDNKLNLEDVDLFLSVCSSFTKV